MEILDDLRLGAYEVKLNHRRLLDAMLDIAGVPPQKFRPICSAIDKLDKEPWEAVRAGERGVGGRAGGPRQRVDARGAVWGRAQPASQHCEREAHASKRNALATAGSRREAPS